MFNLSEADTRLVLNQRRITNEINAKFVQVGAIFLKPQSKLPIEENWAATSFLTTDAQQWIDDDAYRFVNMGFNLQLGWMDIDLDSDDPHFNRCIHSAMRHLKVDSRFAFGRRSNGVPSHIFVQLSEEDAANSDALEKFAPKELRVGNHRLKAELRTSIPTTSKNINLLTDRVKQTVVPGSIYPNKQDVSLPDVSVWYCQDGTVARTLADVAQTTPHRVAYRELVRAIAFGSILYLVSPHWTEGSRQQVAYRLFGWLARVVGECSAISEDDMLNNDIMCPIDSDALAESLIEFLCAELGDDESYMRKRTYHDARRKLELNPDAKIPGWPAIATLLGDAVRHTLRSIVQPGSDASPLARYIEQYVFNEAESNYVDRDKFAKGINYRYSGRDLKERHNPDIIFIAGKPKEAWRIYEKSKLRLRVDTCDTVPDGPVGSIVRIDLEGKVVPDDYAEESKMVFNCWPGWSIKPAANPDPKLLEECRAALNQLLGYLTCDNSAQVEWVWKWIAYILQFPGDKQQVAWMVVGGQGTGKSFMGTQFIPKMFGRLWNKTNGKLFGERFSVAPILGRVIVFIDEVRIQTPAALDELKDYIRSSRISGELKGQDAAEYNNYARFFLAANTFHTGVRHEDTLDRALYITKAFTPEHLGVSQMGFLSGWVMQQKPFFDRFAAMLDRRDVLEHFMYLFMSIKVTRPELEEVNTSAANNSEIIESNLSPSRRRAKDIIEEGRVWEDLDITTPFSKMEFVQQLGERFKTGKPLNPEWVLQEFEKLGMLETTTTNQGRKLRFKWNYGELCLKFGEAIGVPVQPRFDLTPTDSGPNTNDGSGRPVPWRGIRRNKF